MTCAKPTWIAGTLLALGCVAAEPANRPVADEPTPISGEEATPSETGDSARTIQISASSAAAISEISLRNSFGEAMPATGDRTEGEAGDVVAAPIPFANPTIGAGLALAGAYLVKLDPDSPPSVIGGGGMYSANDSFALAAGFKGYFGADRYRVTAAVGRARLNFDLAVGDADVPVREDISGGIFECLIRSFERVYIGPTLVVFGVDANLRREEDEGTIPPDELDTDNYGFGLHALRDTRDSTFYPRTGSLADVEVRTFVPALGNDFSFRILPLSYNHYLSIRDKDVLALRAAARLGIGDVPFYGQSYLGAGPDLRGYAVGTVRDDHLLAVQAEYRRELIWRLGAVAFAGVGTVLPSLDDWSDAEAYPSVGFGLRFLLEEENHVNFRIDFAWGDGQDAIYVSIGEAY